MNRPGTASNRQSVRVRRLLSLMSLRSRPLISIRGITASATRQKPVASGPTSDRRTKIGELAIAKPPATRMGIAQRWPKDWALEGVGPATGLSGAVVCDIIKLGLYSGETGVAEGNQHFFSATHVVKPSVMSQNNRIIEILGCVHDRRRDAYSCLKTASRRKSAAMTALWSLLSKCFQQDGGQQKKRPTGRFPLSDLQLVTGRAKRTVYAGRCLAGTYYRKRDSCDNGSGTSARGCCYTQHAAGSVRHRQRHPQ